MEAAESDTGNIHRRTVRIPDSEGEGRVWEAFIQREYTQGSLICQFSFGFAYLLTMLYALRYDFHYI